MCFFLSPDYISSNYSATVWNRNSFCLAPKMRKKIVVTFNVSYYHLAVQNCWFVRFSHIFYIFWMKVGCIAHKIHQKCNACKSVWARVIPFETHSFEANMRLSLLFFAVLIEFSCLRINSNLICTRATFVPIEISEYSSVFAFKLQFIAAHKQLVKRTIIWCN